MDISVESDIDDDLNKENEDLPSNEVYENTKHASVIWTNMNQKTNVALALAIQLFEEETFDDDLLIIACSKLGAVCNVSLLFRKEDRQRHFRLGQLCGEEWIQYYLDFDFHRLFRMRKDTFIELVNVIAPIYMPKMQRGDAPVITVDKATLIALWYLAGQSAMENGADRFGVAPSTIYHEVHRIVDILCALSHKFIVWPEENECAAIRQQFYDRAGYPGVIGAIDGCHVTVLAPANDHDSYADRKMNHSIILQGIVIFSNVLRVLSANNEIKAIFKVCFPVAYLYG
ncbi:putative nuclease HARBI1 [Odontomachus brunneus]|uniref:putative nuclease HARBI1 n=1 Tax=Odontomachus brunneus TaxID=486640 RepID=UPI0013F2163D|nr:putative nuclease HARBI1 [Odontomachus brunneus]